MKTQPALPQPRNGYQGLAAVDENASWGKHPDRWDKWPSLLLFDTPTLGILEATKELVAGRFRDVEFAVGQAFGDLLQLRASLPPQPEHFYRDQDSKLSTLFEGVRRSQARCHYTESL